MRPGESVVVIGAGGIGQAVGSLCAGVGMRVVGTRRHVSPADALPVGFTRLESPERLHALLAESDFVAVCCQWTPETTGLIGHAAFAAMRPGSVLVNVTRARFQRYPAALITAPIFRCVARLPCVRSTCPRSDSFQLVRLNP